MKKILTMAVVAALTIMSAFTSTAFAQEGDVMKKVTEAYKNVSSMTANVTKTVHNEMVAKDVVTKGTFYFKKPAKLCISTNNGKDKLITDGESFTLVQDGKASTATASTNSTLTPLINVIKGITNGDSNADLSDVADVDMERDGDLLIMTITPIVKSAAERKKMIYQSFVLTIDQKAGELRSLQLNGKGKNWDKYEFTGYKMNAPVSDDVFKA